MKSSPRSLQLEKSPRAATKTQRSQKKKIKMNKLIKKKKKEFPNPSRPDSASGRGHPRRSQRDC